MYEELNAHIQIARVHARWQNWQQRRQQERDEHQSILRALETRDWPRLAAAVNAHIRRSKQSLIEDLLSTTVSPHGTEEVGGARGVDVRVSHAR
jgi:DNA-binding GntR family transcriptional regulator